MHFIHTNIEFSFIDESSLVSARNFCECSCSVIRLSRTYFQNTRLHSHAIYLMFGPRIRAYVNGFYSSPRVPVETVHVREHKHHIYISRNCEHHEDLMSSDTIHTRTNMSAVSCSCSHNTTRAVIVRTFITRKLCASAQLLHTHRSPRHCHPIKNLSHARHERRIPQTLSVNEHAPRHTASTRSNTHTQAQLLSYLTAIQATNHVQVGAIGDAAVHHQHTIVDNGAQRQPPVHLVD